MTRTLRRQGRATLDEVRAFAQEVSATLAGWGFPRERVPALEMAVSEMGTNVCRHGYPPDSPGPLGLEMTWDSSGLTIAIQDQGRSFDPRQIPSPPEPDPEDPDTWPEGGMGLMFVRSAGDDIRYHTDGRINVLSLFAAIPGG